MEKDITIFDTAIHNLDLAIRLFLDEGDYCAPIILAGAAEEVLADELKRNGIVPGHNICKKNLSCTYGVPEKEINDAHTNKVRNWLKHATGPDGKSAPVLRYDDELESIQYIIRAIANYRMLNNGIIESNYEHFVNTIKDKHKDIITIKDN